MTAALEIGIGMIAALGMILVARTLPSRVELLVYAIGLGTAATVYLVFAAAQGDIQDILREIGGLGVFLVIAGLGWRVSPPLLGAGWALHVAWDVLLHPMGEGGYAPGWYPVVCIGFDLSVAAYILGAYGKRGKKS